MNKYRKVKIKPDRKRNLYIDCTSGNGKRTGCSVAQVQLSLIVHDKKGLLITDLTDDEADDIYYSIEQLINGKIR